MGQTEKIIAGLEPPALEGLARAIFPVLTGVGKWPMGAGDGRSVRNAEEKTIRQL